MRISHGHDEVNFLTLDPNWDQTDRFIVVYVNITVHYQKSYTNGDDFAILKMVSEIMKSQLIFFYRVYLTNENICVILLSIKNRHLAMNQNLPCNKKGFGSPAL